MEYYASDVIYNIVIREGKTLQVLSKHPNGWIIACLSQLFGQLYKFYNSNELYAQIYH